MTRPLQPVPVPVTPYFDQVGEQEWVLRSTGLYVHWDEASQVYQQYDPQTGQWTWWGWESRRNCWTWHAYGPTVHENVVIGADFWVHSIIGFVILIGAAASGAPAGGMLVFLVLCCTGMFMNWLRHRHPTAYGVTAAVGLVSTAVSVSKELHRH